jgi:hypothetical protein
MPSIGVLIELRLCVAGPCTPCLLRVEIIGKFFLPSCAQRPWAGCPWALVDVVRIIGHARPVDHPAPSAGVHVFGQNRGIFGYFHR